MIKLETTDKHSHAKSLLQGLTLTDFLSAQKEERLEDAIENWVSENLSLSEPSAQKARETIYAYFVSLAERAIANGCDELYALEPRMLAVVDNGHQLIAWRTVRDKWLAKHNSSLDGMYLKQRLASELPGFELCPSGYCKNTKREASEELITEAKKVNGEVRWYLPEGRLIVAVKFPPNFKHTDFARWSFKRERAHFNSNSVLSKEGMNEERWDKFVDGFIQRLKETMNINAKTIQESGATFNINIKVLESSED